MCGPFLHMLNMKAGWSTGSSFGKDLRMAKTLKSGGRVALARVGLEAIGRGPSGCLSINSFQVASLIGTIPENYRTWHAFPNRPSLASETAVCMIIILGNGFGQCMANSMPPKCFKYTPGPKIT